MASKLLSVMTKLLSTQTIAMSISLSHMKRHMAGAFLRGYLLALTAVENLPQL